MNDDPSLGTKRTMADQEGVRDVDRCVVSTKITFAVEHATIVGRNLPQKINKLRSDQMLGEEEGTIGVWVFQRSNWPQQSSFTTLPIVTSTLEKEQKEEDTSVLLDLVSPDLLQCSFFFFFFFNPSFFGCTSHANSALIV